MKQNFHIKVRHIPTWCDIKMSQYDVMWRHHVICDSKGHITSICISLVVGRPQCSLELILVPAKINVNIHKSRVRHYWPTHDPILLLPFMECLMPWRLIFILNFCIAQSTNISLHCPTMVWAIGRQLCNVAMWSRDPKNQGRGHYSMRKTYTRWLLVFLGSIGNSYI